MTLIQMKYFSTVCACQNISLAARLLYISQPALSASLAQIEREVGFKLFLRKSKGVYPTEEGLQLLTHVDAVLKRADLMNHEIPLISQNQTLIKIGFRPYAGETTFFHIYQGFAKLHPEIQLKVNVMSNTTPYVFLKESQIDFLIAPPKVIRNDKNYTQYESCRIGTEKMELFSHQDSRLAQQEPLPLEEFVKEPFVFWTGHQTLLSRLETMLKTKNLTWNIVGVLPQVTSLLHFISNNMASGFIAANFTHAIPGIRESSIPDELLDVLGDRNIPIYAYWNKSIEKYKNKKLFINYLRSLNDSSDAN